MAEIMSIILLFKSIIFTASNLYADQTIKRSSSILESALNKLVELDFILEIKKGFYSSKWTCIFIKKLPDPFSTDEQLKFECKLGQLGVPGLNLESYRETCGQLIIDGKGKIGDKLIHVLQGPEYLELDLDISDLIQRSGKYVVFYVKYSILLNRTLSIC
jgi:hypothetical protein